LFQLKFSFKGGTAQIGLSRPTFWQQVVFFPAFTSQRRVQNVSQLRNSAMQCSFKPTNSVINYDNFNCLSPDMLCFTYCLLTYYLYTYQFIGLLRLVDILLLHGRHSQ